MKQPHKTLLLWVVLIVAFLAIWQFLSPEGPQKQPMPFSEFIALVKAPKDQRHVEAVEVKDREYVFQIKNPASKGPAERGISIGPSSDEIAAELLKHDVRITYQKDESNPFLTTTLTILLPMLFLLVLFYLFMRQLQAGGGKAMSFGKSRARLLNESQNKVTFADVAGIDEAKDEVEEIIAFLKDPKKFQKLGGRIPKGVLMMGPPGTGKTLLARAIAGEAGVPFFSISGSDFVEMFVGVGASRVRDLFEQGKKHAPCIIFIDEIDAVGRHRGAGLGGGHDEREQTLNQLLIELDGFEQNQGIVLIAATNRPDVIDPALLRPGRFDRQINIPLPHLKGREEILKVHARNVKLAEGVDLAVVARRTPGFSGADLANVVNEAALLAARKKKDFVDLNDLEESIERVMAGPQKRSSLMSEKEKRVVAYHESGHTLVAKLLPNTDPVHKVSIVSRGHALGYTLQLPTEDKYLTSRTEILNRLAVLLGGRVAEELIFQEITTGAADDIAKVSSYAMKMVTEFGMSDKVGPMALKKPDEQVFLGRDISQKGGYSEETARLIDEEVKRIVSEAHAKARELLTKHKKILDNLANTLFDREVLNGEDIDAILQAGLA